MEVLNLFDITILTIILISCLFAFFKGFVISFLSLGNWLISIVITYIAFPHISGFLYKYISLRVIVVTLSSVGVFFTIALIIGMFNARFADVLGRYINGFIDRVLGVGFGLLRGLVISSVVFFVINVISKELKIGDNPDRPGPEFFVNARLYDTLWASTNLVVSFLPYDVTEDSEKVLGDIKQSTKQRLNYIEQKEEEEEDQEKKRFFE